MGVVTFFIFMISYCILISNLSYSTNNSSTNSLLITTANVAAFYSSGLVTIQVALTRLHIFPRSEEKLDIK